MKLLYFPGCTLKTYASNLETSAIAVMKSLGYELKEMENWNCCGVVSSLSEDDLMRHIAPLRNLIHVENEGENKLITICDMCYNTIKQTALRMKERSEDLEALNAFMDDEKDYRGTVRVYHLLEFLRDEIGFNNIKKKVKNPLNGIRIMPYYGCMLLRPREIAIDDAEDPKILEDLISTLGGEVVDNPFKIECCGSYHTIENKEIISKRAYRITSYAIERGAEAIMLSCPLCMFNLDSRGKEAEKKFKEYKQIPIYYYTQLIAVALGLDSAVCGFSKHKVDPTFLLKKKGVFIGSV